MLLILRPATVRRKQEEMQTKISEKLETILSTRAQQAKSLRDTEAQWTTLATALGELSSALCGLEQHPAAPEGIAGLRAELDFLPPQIERGVLPRLQRVRQRFSRSTLNIGVAGEARMGKSTLLQKISGLGEGQIPTGDNLPVTAVRSRIFHMPGEARARLGFHDWESFRNSVLVPYYDRLNWGLPPATPALFKKAQLGAIDPEHPNAENLKGLRDRVRNMQRSLPTYEDQLTGDSRIMGLEHLRPFVAYPKADEEHDESRVPRRRYLAVREALIECEFPGLDVRNIGLIDLPGTGEIEAAGDERHVSGLEDEVDLVFLISNPKKKAYWSKEAVRTLDLVRRARCGAEANDFCLLVVNEGGASETQIGALVGDIRKKTEGSYQIIPTNAIDATDVRARLMQPALQHLAQRLPAMDAAARRYAIGDTSGLLSSIKSVLASIKAALQNDVPGATTATEEAIELAEQLQEELASNLEVLVRDLLNRSRGPEAENEEFEAAVAGCYQAVRSWLAGGLGRPEDVWLVDAQRKMELKMSSGELVADELNRIRVHVAGEFNKLDDHLTTQVEGLWGQIVAILGPRLGIVSDTPQAALKALEERLVNARCTAMATSVEELLGARLDYRTQFHPRLRQQLDVLHPQVVDPETRIPRARIEVTPNENGAEEALRLLREHGERAAWEAQKALLRDVSLPALVLHAAAEQFTDALLRSGTARKEFRRLALANRDEIWPGRFEALDQAHRLFSDANTALATASSAANQLNGGVQ